MKPKLDALVDCMKAGSKAWPRKKSGLADANSGIGMTHFLC